jgi:hypothetical protein
MKGRIKGRIKGIWGNSGSGVSGVMAISAICN